MNGKLNNHYKSFINDTKTMFKEFSSKKTRRKQVANMLSFYRLISPIPTIICASIAILTNSFSLMIIAMGFGITGGISDAIDGKYARKYNTTSEYGKKLDQYCDKVFAGTFALFLSILNPLFIVITSLEVTIALVNYYYFKNYNLNQDSLMIGKIKQTPLFISLGLGFLNALLPEIKLVTNVMGITTIIFQSGTILTYIRNYKAQLNTINQQKNESNNRNHLENEKMSDDYTNEKNIKKEKRKNAINASVSYSNELTKGYPETKGYELIKKYNSKKR